MSEATSAVVPQAGGPVATTVVGRQSIHDAAGAVVAHELLFRTPGAESAGFADADGATAEVLVSAFTEIGLDDLVGDHLAFVNIPYGFLVDGLCSILPRDRVVLEILEDVPVDDRVVRALRTLAADGYTIALDDYEFRPETAPLLELAGIVKVDVLALTGDDLARTVDRVRGSGRRLLAEKVEDRADVPRLAALGFDLFQGYGLERPRVVGGAHHTMTLRVMSALQRPDLEITGVAEIIAQDPSLAYALLRIVNSAAMNRGGRIGSLHQAVVLLGVDALRNWATLLLMTRVTDGSPAGLAPVLIRADLCRRLVESGVGGGTGAGGGTRLSGGTGTAGGGGSTGRRADDAGSGSIAFTVGLLSTLPDILGEPIEAIVERLPLDGPVASALLDGEGPYGRVLALVRAYQDGDHATLAELGGPPGLASAYLASTAWANRLVGPLAGAAGEGRTRRRGR